MPEYETVLVSVDDGVALLTLNRPDRANSFNLVMDREFHQAMWALEDDPAVRVIVVTGAGKAFCGGVDLEAGAGVFGEEAHKAHDATLGLDADSLPERSAFWRMRTPIIGAINGAAVGAGLTVPLLFDILYAAADAKLGFVFSRRGIFPEANSTWLLPRLIGVPRAMELLLTGRMFTGAEAAAMGLVSRALPREELLPGRPRAGPRPGAQHRPHPGGADQERGVSQPAGARPAPLHGAGDQDRLVARHPPRRGGGGHVVLPEAAAAVDGRQAHPDATRDRHRREPRLGPLLRPSSLEAPELK